MSWPAPSKPAMRFLDSSEVGEWRAPLRTLRANDIIVRHDLNRIYMRLGSGVIVWYQLDTFFARLAAGEQLTTQGNKERILGPGALWNVDRSGWKTFNMDNPVIVTGFDVDDRGITLIAGTIFGWGAADPALRHIFQHTDADGGNAPGKIVALKGSARYYALMSSGRNSAMFDVTNIAQKGVKLNAPPPKIQSWAKTTDASRCAIVHRQTRQLLIYTADGLAAGAPPLYTSPENGYVSVTSDGTNFYALRGNWTTGGTEIAILTPAGATFSVAGVSVVDLTYCLSIHYGDGHLVAVGMGATNSNDMRVYAVSGFALTPVVSVRAPTVAGYIKMDVGDGVVVASGGKTYLVANWNSVGEVYEIVGGAVVVPPVVVPPVIVPPVVTPPQGRGVTIQSREFANAADAQAWANSMTITTTLPPRTTSKGTIVVDWF